MSDGDGKDSVKFSSEEDNQKSSKKKSRSDDFSQGIARIAMAQVCEGLGFQSFQQSALDTLADVAVRYIREIGSTASLRANLTNRSQCNVFDVIQGLEDLGSIQGLSGASDVSHSLSESGVVRDIIRYVGEAEEIPFAYLIPGFPVAKERKLNPSAKAQENPPDEHIPSWLPKFPDPETYTELSSEKKKESDSLADDKIQRVQVQHRQVERQSFNLQQSLNCNGPEAGVTLEQDAAAHRAAEINPYLAPPLHFGEKEVHVPVIPAKLLDDATWHHRSREVTENHVSASESLLPANESDEKRKILQNGRPNVHFKFGNGKKSLGMRRSSRIEGVEKISLWFADDDDDGGKDEMKRKAEQIFREKVEYSQETSQL